MKTKIFKYLFFATIVSLIAIAIYMIYINKQSSKTNLQPKKADNVLSNNITIGIVNFDSLNPHISINQDVQYLSKLIYKDLIGLTKDFKLEASLAKEWSRIGKKVYIVKLKEDIVWSNGEKFTADDVEFTINELKKESSKSIYKDNVKNIERIEKIDNLTVKIYLYEEEEFFEYNLCMPILCSKIESTKEIIGNGDYKIVDINEKYILLQKFENNKSPKKIKIVLYNNYSDLYSDFSKKKIDVITTYNINFDNYVGTIGIEEKKIVGRNIIYIRMNKENKKMQDTNLRKTIKNIINKDEIIYNVYKNKYIKADFALNYGSYLNYKKNTEDSYIKQYNLKFNLDIKDNDEEQKNVAEEIKKQLSKLGITLNVIENSENVYNKKLENKDYEMIICKDRLSITPTITQYVNTENTEIYKMLENIKNIDNTEILKREYNKIIEMSEKENNIIYIAFDSIIILHNSNVKGDFSGNWYNILYNVDTWYKEL